jgi:hypothetical protein
VDELRVECRDNRIFVFGDATLNATLKIRGCPEYPVHVESSGGMFALPTIVVQQGVKKLVADTDHFTVIVIPRVQEKE